MAKSRDDARITRLISLAYFLSTKTEIHIDELSERLGISRKQVEADLNVLMFCGVPPYSPGQLFDIVIEDEFVSIYFNDVFIKPMRLSEQEKSYVLLALERMKASEQKEDAKTIDMIIRAVGGTSSNISMSQSSVYDETIVAAIEKKEYLSISYLSLSSASIRTRVIVPRALYPTASVSYVFAYSPENDATRVFRSDRILSLTSTGDIYEDAIDVDIAQQESGQLYIEDKSEYVDLRISDKAGWILDSYPSHVIDESRRIYRFNTPSPYFVARLLLISPEYVTYVTGSFDHAAIVNAVEQLRSRMTSTSKGQYGGD